MSTLFSAQFKYSTWRRLWIALAKAEKKMGLPITEAQIQAMQAEWENIDFARVAEWEKKTHHDVMAHVHAFGEQCPTAKKILHLGATSAFVTDNTDLIQMQEGLKLLKVKLIQVIRQLKILAEKHADLPTLSYTHLQPAQPTTVGKRICLWLQDLLWDCKDLVEKEENLPFLGLKGATGTQSSFMSLLDHDLKKVEKLDLLVAEEMGFKNLLPISGQTYTRKIDMRIFSALEGLAASSHKCGTDLRLLSHLGEMEEGIGEHQVGSSAMPHKRNPIHAERVCGLSRFLISLSSNPSYTLATQWLERSLDDSANRRLVIPEGFLAADGVLNLLLSLFSKLQIYPKVIQENLQKELPYLALESILMLSVKKGNDRQEVHERLRIHSLKGKEDLLEMIQKDKKVGLTKKEIEQCLPPSTGRSKQQVIHFIKEEVDPFLKLYTHLPPPAFNVEL